MATMIDVANRANVSIATVSRVLNGMKNVDPEMARRVQEAVAELQYEPNYTARNLRCRESRTLIILTPNITNLYYSNIIAGIAHGAQEHGYSYFLFNTEGKRELEEQILDRLEKRQADGAILLGAELGANWIQKYADQYPIVQCSEFDPSYNIPHVSIDNYQAARDAVEYLIGKGHTRIGTVSSNNRFFSSVERMRGFRDALTDAGLTVNEEYIRYAAWDNFKASSKAAYSLLKGQDHPTALFCISDILALGAIASAKELGLRVPEDISVIGFDDVEYTTMFHPYVTTVVQPCYEIGYHALDLVCNMIRRKDVPKTTLLQHHLVFRESVAVLPPDTQ